MFTSKARFIAAFILLLGQSVFAVEKPAPQTLADVRVEGAYINVPLPGKGSTAGFFTLHNRSDKDIALVAVQSDLAERIELHSHSHEDGMMKMRKEQQVVIPAHSRVAFAPMAYHLMFFNVLREIRTGDEVGLTLIFEGDQRYPVTAQVRSLFDHKHH